VVFGGCELPRLRFPHSLAGRVSVSWLPEQVTTVDYFTGISTLP